MNSDHPIVSKIQAWIIKFHSRHKSMQLCWVPSHINIAGNERADQLAKQGALSQDDLAYELYPYKDYYPIIKKSVVSKWQQKWITVNYNKLRTIKYTVKSWSSSTHKVRNMEVLLTRLRIGHTRLTHGHLMEQRPALYW